MSRTPIAASQTEGRTLATDSSIANVVKLLRANAERGAWRSTDQTRGGLAAANQYYVRRVSAKHLPTSVSVIFMRLAEEKCWYASLCFAGDDGYLPWDAEAAELWLCALFGEDLARVRVEDEENPSVRQFILSDAVVAGYSRQDDAAANPQGRASARRANAPQQPLGTNPH